MNLKNNIIELCKANNMTVKDLEARTSISIGTIGRWDKSVPSVDKVVKVAAYFGITVDNLINGFYINGLQVITPGAAPKGKDKELLDAYHKATPLDRAIIDNIVSRYAAEDEDKIIPLISTAAAAGPGEPDTELPWEDYKVPATSSAEFAIRVSGDSMTPVLQDGEIALCVKRRPEIGDLAVIMVNGALLVKQYIRDNYGNVYLRSLNRARKDCDYDLMASGNDTAMYYGKVILAHKLPLVEQ